MISRLTNAIIFTSLLLFLNGCAPNIVNVTQTIPSSRVQILNTRVEYIDKRNQRVPNEYNPKEVTLLFPYIAGQIFGNPRDKSLYVKQLKGGLEFSLDLKDKLDEIDKVASVLKNAPGSSGLEIMPLSTKFARIETFAFNSISGEPFGAVGFIDPTSRDNLILVYVDRECYIKGTVYESGDYFDHEIYFDGKGFHWIKVIQKEKGKYLLKEFPQDKDVLFQLHF